MAYITEPIDYQSDVIDTTYDSNLITITAGKYVNGQKTVVMTANNGYEIADNANIVVKRSGRANYVLNTVESNKAVVTYKAGTRKGYFTEIALSVGLANVDVLEINTDNMNYIDVTPKTANVELLSENVEVTIKDNSSPFPSNKKISYNENVDLKYGNYTFNFSMKNEYEPLSGYIETDNSTIDLVVENGNIKAIDLDIDGSSSNYKIFVTTDVTEPEPEPEPEPDTVDVILTNRNVKVSAENVETGDISLIENGTISKLEVGSYIFSFSIDEGYIPLSGKIIRDYAFNVPDIELEIIDNHITDKTVYIDNEYRKYTIEIRLENEDFEITGIFNNVYLIENKDLKNVYEQVFGAFKEIPDLSPYFISLLKLPFKISDEFISETDTVKAGNIDFIDVEVPTINNDKILVELGNIKTESKYNNLLDYINTETILHIPFSDSVTIPTDYVIDETISINFIINVYDGETTINVKTTKTNEVIHSSNVMIGELVPIISRVANDILSEGQFRNNIYNGLTKAFIEVNRNIPNNIDDVMVTESGVLNEYVGYVRVTDFEMPLVDSIRDKTEINTKLNEGVYING